MKRIVRRPSTTAHGPRQPAGKTIPKTLPVEIDRWINEGGALGRGKSLDTPIGNRIDAGRVLPTARRVK